MKRLLPIILILTLLLVGCGGGKEVDYTTLSVEEIVENIAEKERFEVDDISENNNSYKIILKTSVASDKAARKTLLMKTKDILKKLEGKGVEFINIEWQVELVDKFGNAEYTPVMRLDFTKEILDKINWDNFDYNNLDKIADDYWEHQVLKAGD